MGPWARVHSCSDEGGYFAAGRRRHGHRGGGGIGGHGSSSGGPSGGEGPWGGSPWGGPLSFFLHHRMPRARRGDVRAGILALLAEEPRNGYQIMQQLEQRSRGIWRPSPGSIYPALQQLEDEGLVRETQSGGGRVFELTERGRAHVKEHADELSAPWNAMSNLAGDEIIKMIGLCRQLGVAAVQVARIGNAAQIAEARKVVADARRALYRILAEDAPDRE